MSKAVSQFYDQYHQKNDHFHKVINKKNFTYYYLFELMAQAGIEDVQGLKILDVGCGVGTMSLYFAAHGAQVSGIDISPRAISIAQAAAKDLGLKNVSSEVGEVKKGTAKFDLILCSEVVEHVPDQLGFLKILRSHLKDNGKLILTTPSQENLLYKLGYYKRFDAEVGHLRRYTMTSLPEILSEAGLKPSILRGVEGPLRNILFTSKLGVLIRFIKGPLIPLFHYLDMATAAVFGPADLQVVAEKK